MACIAQARLSRRKLLALGTSGVAALGGLGMPAIAQTRKLKFTLPWLAEGSSAYIYLAKYQGFMAKQGIDMEISRGFGSVAAAQAIAAGQFDMGAVVAPALVLSIAQGMPLYSVGVIEYDAAMGVCVTGDSSITMPADLMGKKVGAVPTSAEFPFFPAYCKKAGIDMSKIEIVQLDNKVRERALMDKQVDAITGIAGSILPILMAKGDKPRFMLYGSAGVSNYGSCITVTKKAYDADPALCEAAVTGLLEALKFSLIDPEATKEIFYKAVPEITMSASGKEFTTIGLGLKQVGVLQPVAKDHGLGWGEPAVFDAMASMVMEYIQKPGMTKPTSQDMFTNKAVGKVKLSAQEGTMATAHAKPYTTLLA
ncbi:ABC transporter substrate-binding protein [soil metagenome]